MMLALLRCSPSSSSRAPAKRGMARELRTFATVEPRVCVTAVLREAVAARVQRAEEGLCPRVLMGSLKVFASARKRSTSNQTEPQGLSRVSSMFRRLSAFDNLTCRSLKEGHLEHRKRPQDSTMYFVVFCCPLQSTVSPAGP